jgi:tetratricopeptide (TPR) repeat protein
LTYDGQYRDLKKYERAGVRTLLRIIDDTATSYPLRLAACRAIADVAGESVLPELRSLHDDILLPPPLREQIGILLAIYGDTRAVDKQLRDLERYARRPDLSIRIAAITELSHLYYRVRDYARAVEYYDEILAAYEDFAKRATIPELQESINDQLTLHYYNAACSNSLKGDVARAQELLRKAIKRDPMHLDNIELDGDLRNVREDPSYAAFRKALGELFEGEDL